MSMDDFSKAIRANAYWSMAFGALKDMSDGMPYEIRAKVWDIEGHMHDLGKMLSDHVEKVEGEME